MPDLFISLTSMAYNDTNTHDIDWQASAKTLDGVGDTITGTVTVNGLSTSTSVHSAIKQDCRDYMTNVHSVSFGPLDKTFLFGLGFHGVL